MDFLRNRRWVLLIDAQHIGFPFNSPTKAALGSQARKHAASCRPGRQPSFTIAFIMTLSNSSFVVIRRILKSSIAGTHVERVADCVRSPFPSVRRQYVNRKPRLIERQEAKPREKKQEMPFTPQAKHSTNRDE